MSAARESNNVVPLHSKQTGLFATMGPVMEQMRAMANRSGDALYLSDGPVNPDHALLDLCADALHFAKAAETAMDSRHIYRIPEWGSSGRAAWDKRDNEMLEQYRLNTHEVVQRLRHAKKMKAKTAAGIYAKALLVRISKTGATGLAMSLAEDLVACEGLRATLWLAGEP